MDQRLSLVTLGVADERKAAEFYGKLGWSGTEASSEEDNATFFQAGCMIVALWKREKLEADSAVTDNGGWGGITLAYNTRSPEEVDAVIDEARAAGATIAREPGETFWGGYSAIFSDPDGHPWEVAHNPRWTIEDDGAVTI